MGRRGKPQKAPQATADEDQKASEPADASDTPEAVVDKDVFRKGSWNDDDAPEMVNDEGAPVKLGTRDGFTEKYYCSRNLGRVEIPFSDGRCGPNKGPQCASCKRFQAAQKAAAPEAPEEPTVRSAADYQLPDEQAAPETAASAEASAEAAAEAEASTVAPPIADASAEEAPSAAKKKGAAALLKGLRSGEVSKLVDGMEEEAVAPAPEELCGLRPEAPAPAAPEAEPPTVTVAEAAAAEEPTESKRHLTMMEEPEVAAEPSMGSCGDTESTPWAAAEKRLRELLPGIKDSAVLQELADLPDSAALERLVQKGKPPAARVHKASWQQNKVEATFSSSTPSPPRTSVKNNIFAANERKSVSEEASGSPKSGPKSLCKMFGTVDSKSLAVGGAGQGGGLGLNKPGSGPKVQHFAGRASVGGLKSLNIEEDVSSAWSEMMDDSSSIGWVIAAYSDDNKSLRLQDKGEGSLNIFKDKLPENLAWGGFRCYGVDKRGGLECKRPKFIFVQYKHEASSAIKKAKMASHKGEVKESFPGAHLDVVVETMGDLDEQTLISKLQAATGAHKPNGYEFEEGRFLEADFYGLGIGKSCKGESSKN